MKGYIVVVEYIKELKKQKISTQDFNFTPAFNCSCCKNPLNSNYYIINNYVLNTNRDIILCNSCFELFEIYEKNML